MNQEKETGAVGKFGCSYDGSMTLNRRAKFRFENRNTAAALAEWLMADGPIFSAATFWQYLGMKAAQTHVSDVITASDVAHVRDSFRLVEVQSGPAADRFFRELFSYDRSLRDHFAPDRWSRNENLISALRNIVNQIEGLNESTNHLSGLAKKYPAYARSNYYHLYFGAALFSMLEDVLGARFNSVVYGAWFKVFQRVVAVVKAQAVGSGVAADRSELSFAHPTAA